MKNILLFLEKFRIIISGWISFIFIIGTFFSSISLWYGRIKNPFLIFLNNYFITFFLFSAISIIIYFYFRISFIEKRIKVFFKENFKKNLHENWDYTGDWKIEDGCLSVTHSDAGGITKIGSFWENYEFEFETKILNIFSGWIVRAKDINNYFMFQIDFENIRPHLRISDPILAKQSDDTYIVTRVDVGWKLFGTFPHYQDLRGKWFKVKTLVKGSRVDIFINNINIFHQDNILTIPTGKVGFREAGEEHAHFRNVRVRQID